MKFMSNFFSSLKVMRIVLLSWFERAEGLDHFVV
jgi:hypothetical protein